MSSVISASLISGSFVLLICALFVAFRRRFRVKAHGFEVESDEDRGLSAREIDKRIHQVFRQYLGLIDSYNRETARHDHDCRIIITHKLDDVAVPVEYAKSEVSGELMRLNIRYELLIMNLENHYDDATQSEQKLTGYLSDKYGKLVTVVSPFVRDPDDAYFVAYQVLCSWWVTVGNAVHSRAVYDLETDGSLVDALDDPAWKRRIRDLVRSHQNTVSTIEGYPTPRPAAILYFTAANIAVPDFLGV